ncbi:MULTISPECIES: tail fiber protein [Chromobacterium]|uniref:tail fiber protein n=1 Tax=Chromobacterium TaxID=535 RepID=UPI0009DF289B|nr:MULTISPECIES: tail fiber protein [Chromobacterium]WON82297.1 tail fiber protein [Chromobacterium haemolyticum]
MQETIKPIPTPDKLFHDGNPVSGELGTIVSAEWLNGMQSAAQATQDEVLAVIKDSGQSADPKRKDQLLQAVKQIAWGGNNKPTTLAGYGITDALPLKPALGVVDLNDMIAPGIYNQRENAKATSGKNYPMPYAGKLQVYADEEMVYQSYQAYNNAGIWYRCCYLGNWAQWQKQADAASTLAGYGITDGATKAELKAAVDGVVNGAPGALDTLQELAAALGNDKDFAATITNKLAGKADKADSLAGYGINTLALSTPQTVHVQKTTPNNYDANIFSSGTMELRSAGVDFPSLGLHRPGYSAVALVHMNYGDDTLVLKEATGNEFRVWHAGNDGQFLKKRRFRIDPQDGTSLDTSITGGEMGFNYGTSSGVTGPFIAFGGLGGQIDYSCQLTADYQRGSTMRFRTRNDDAKRWNPWHTLIHDGHLTGQVAYFATGDAPEGWLKANGTAVSRTEYAALFAAIGTRFGVGDGATTFNLPDLRGEFIRGWDDGRGVDAGRNLGASQNPTYIRNLIDKLSGSYPVGTSAIGAWNTEGWSTNVEGNKTPTDLSNTTFYVAAASAVPGGGDNGAFSTRPRNVALLACIKF